MRPATRPLHRLPTLESRRSELETCAFCPKLCRTTCPVSNAAPHETLIPWGKMTNAYALAAGDETLDRTSGAPEWACTGCLACTGACHHGNPVADTLFDARHAVTQAGAAPDAARSVVARHPERVAEASAAADVLDPPGSTADTLLLLGCVSLRKDPDTAANTLKVARAVLGPTRVHRGCCGLPLLHAGDRDGFVRAVSSLRTAASGAKRFVVADPGCAHALMHLAPKSVSSERAPELLLDVARAALDRFAPQSVDLGALRYHDPCLLGRGLGRYDEPRRLLAHVTKQPVGEFIHAREAGLCSGGGGLLPVTMPSVSAAIADARNADVGAAAGAKEPIVTACASSLRSFRRAGKVAYDLYDVLARALGGERSP